MPLPPSLAFSLGRPDAASGYVPAGSSVQNNGGNTASGIAASASFTLGTGRDSLILLAALVAGVVALSWWTR